MILNRNLKLAGLAFGLWSLAYNLTAPLLPLLARELGAAPVQAGLAAAAGPAGAVALILPLSILSDRRGRKEALLAGWLLSAFGLLLMSGARSWAGLLPGAFFSQAVIAALPTLNTLILEETEPSLRSRAFALLYSAGPLGLLIGSAAGGYLAENFGLRATVLAAGACSVGAALAVLTARPVSPINSEREPAVSENPARRSWSAMAFVAAASLGFLLVSLPGQFVLPYLHEIGGQSLLAAGLYSSLLAGSQLAWSLFFSVWPRTPGKIRLVMKGSVLTLPAGPLAAIAICLAANAAFGLLLPSKLPGSWALAIFLRGSLYSLQSLGSGLLGDVVSPGPARATRLTGYGAGIGLAAAGAPVLAGWLYGANPSLPFWVSGAAGAAGSAFLLALLSRPARAGAG